MRINFVFYSFLGGSLTGPIPYNPLLNCQESANYHNGLVQPDKSGQSFYFWNAPFSSSQPPLENNFHAQNTHVYAFPTHNPPVDNNLLSHQSNFQILSPIFQHKAFHIELFYENLSKMKLSTELNYNSYYCIYCGIRRLLNGFLNNGRFFANTYRIENLVKISLYRMHNIYKNNARHILSLYYLCLKPRLIMRSLSLEFSHYQFFLNILNGLNLQNNYLNEYLFLSINSSISLFQENIAEFMPGLIFKNLKELKKIDARIKVDQVIIPCSKANQLRLAKTEDVSNNRKEIVVSKNLHLQNNKANEESDQEDYKVSPKSENHNQKLSGLAMEEPPNSKDYDLRNAFKTCKNFTQAQASFFFKLIYSLFIKYLGFTRDNNKIKYNDYYTKFICLIALIPDDAMKSKIEIIQILLIVAKKAKNPIIFKPTAWECLKILVGFYNEKPRENDLLIAGRIIKQMSLEFYEVEKNSFKFLETSDENINSLIKCIDFNISSNKEINKECFHSLKDICTQTRLRWNKIRPKRKIKQRNSKF